MCAESTSRAITRSSFVSLGLVVGIVVATYWATNAWASLESSIRESKILTNQRLADISREVADVKNLIVIDHLDRWTETDMRFWALQLHDANEELVLPPVIRAVPHDYTGN